MHTCEFAKSTFIIVFRLTNASNSISSSALVGYAAIDGSSTFVDDFADYLACDHGSGGGALDLFGLNN